MSLISWQYPLYVAYLAFLLSFITGEGFLIGVPVSHSPVLVAILYSFLVLALIPLNFLFHKDVFPGEQVVLAGQF
jgi:hypothetical protein